MKINKKNAKEFKLFMSEVQWNKLIHDSGCRWETAIWTFINYITVFQQLILYHLHQNSSFSHDFISNALFSSTISFADTSYSPGGNSWWSYSQYMDGQLLLLNWPLEVCLNQNLRHILNARMQCSTKIGLMQNSIFKSSLRGIKPNTQIFSWFHWTYKGHLQQVIVQLFSSTIALTCCDQN